MSPIELLVLGEGDRRLGRKVEGAELSEKDLVILR